MTSSLPVPITRVRWRSGQTRLLHRHIEPLSEDHPALALPCLACSKPLGKAPIVVIILGPGDDPEDRHRHLAWRPYSAFSIMLHAACVLGKDPLDGRSE